MKEAFYSKIEIFIDELNRHYKTAFIQSYRPQISHLKLLSF